MTSISHDQIDLDDEQALDVLNNLPSIVLFLDEELTVEFANQSLYQFVDPTPEEIIGDSISSFLPDHLSQKIEQELDQLSPETPERRQNLATSKKQGKKKRHEWTFRFATKEPENGCYYYVFGPDVEDSSINESDPQNEDEVKSLNNAALHKVTNSIREAFWVMDANWSEILHFNSASEKLYGVSSEKLREQPENWTKHIQPDDLDRMYSNLTPDRIKDLTHSITVQFRLDHPEKGRRHIELELSPIPEDGKTRRLVGLASDVTEEEKKLQKSQKKFEAIFNSTVSSLGWVRPDGTLLEANQTALDRVDASMEELRGRTLWECPWWNHSESLQNRIREAVQTAARGEVDQFEAHYPLPDGKDGCYELTMNPVQNENGTVEYIVPEARDITAQKRLQEKLQEQRNFLDSIINAAQQAIFVKTADGRYVLANETVSNIFGVPCEEIEGKTDYDFLDDEIADKFSRDDQRVLKTGEPIQEEQDLYHADRGETRTFLTVKTTLLEDNPPEDQLILGISTDITRRKNLERKLEQQKDFLQTIIDSAPNFIFVKDWNGVYQNANETVADFYDTTPDELIGNTDEDFNTDSEEPESFREDDRDVMRSGEVKEIPEEPVTNSRTGRTHWFQTTKVPLFTDQPVEERQVLGVSTEITEKKNIREHLEESLREKETLLGEIHHRVKNNLQIIQSMLRMEIRESEQENPALQDCINRVYSMAILHEKLYQSEKLNEIDISSYFDEICQHLKEAVGTRADQIDISFSVELGFIPIKEAVSCGLIVNELVTNALQHGFEDGEAGQINVSFQSQDGNYEIIVEDNGHGFPDDIDIADVESTGLRIIRSIVEYEFDGEINFHVNGGVRVEIVLNPDSRDT